MLEGLRAVIGVDLEVTMRVARDLRGAESAQFRVHRFAGMLRSGDEIDLVLLHHPAGDVAGVVGREFLGREGLDAAQ